MSHSSFYYSKRSLTQKNFDDVGSVFIAVCLPTFLVVDLLIIVCVFGNILPDLTHSGIM